MDDGLHIVASSMNSVSRHLDVATYNAVNSTIPGFQNRVITTRSFETKLDRELAREPSLLNTEEVNAFISGSVVPSANPMALALQGDGFFTIQTPKGRAYTRNGDFMLDKNGALTTRAGYPVLGENGQLRTSKTDVAPHFDPETGSLFQGDQEIGRPRIVEFANTGALVRVATTIFEAPSEAGERPPQGTAMITNSLELPSERGLTSMVGLITANREFEASQRVASVMQRTYERLISRNA